MGDIPVDKKKKKNPVEICQPVEISDYSLYLGYESLSFECVFKPCSLKPNDFKPITRNKQQKRNYFGTLTHCLRDGFCVHTPETHTHTATAYRVREYWTNYLFRLIRLEHSNSHTYVSKCHHCEYPRKHSHVLTSGGQYFYFITVQVHFFQVSELSILILRNFYFTTLQSLILYFLLHCIP